MTDSSAIHRAAQRAAKTGHRRRWSWPGGGLGLLGSAPALAAGEASVSLAPSQLVCVGVCMGALAVAGVAIKRARAAERQLSDQQDEERRLSSALDQSGLVLWDWNVESGELRFSQAWSGLSGSTARVARPDERRRHIAAADTERIDALVHALLEGREPHFVAQYTLRSDAGGELRVVERARVVARAEDGRARRILGTVEAVDERPVESEQVHWMAAHDSLTGLPNRMVLTDRLNQALNHAERFNHQLAVIFLDIDHFKRINDEHGHRLGDLVLVQLAQRLQRSLRRVDTVSRRGGDEFVILLPELESAAQAARVCDKVAAQVKEPLRIDARDLQISVSMGVAMYPSDARDGEGLIQLADLALYRSKRAGRRCITFYDSALDQHVRETSNLEEKLRSAIERHSFRLWYQPQYDLASGELLGVEALIRWIDADGKVLMPTQFIPIAERYGHIHALGDWSIQTACADIKSVQDHFPRPIQVSVNVSPMQLRSPGLQAQVRRALEGTDWPASQLVIEANELAVMDDVETARRALGELGALGVGVALDNFGTGLSRVPLLRRYHLHHLKIDRGLVKEMRPGSDDDAVVGGIIQMAHRLGLKVIAEGVETRAQASLLRQHGCDSVQGNLFCPAVPKEQLAALQHLGRDAMALR